MVAPSTQLPPILGLRMRNRSSRNSSRTPTRPDTGCCHNPILLADRVKAMLMQDKSNTYACDDKYSQRSISSTATAQGAAVDSVDTVCREKMVEWMYRVADHFNEDREIVAMGQSALDRFVSKCSCDRSAFKLAAMTTLYICSKTNGVWTFDNHHPHYPHHRPSLTVQSLAELSRGEFDVQHITEMEMIVLQTLGWRVNPPTVQSFIHSFYFYLPVLRSTAATAGSPSSLSSHHQQNMIASAILNRAVFFAELAVYDHAFVRTERALLALSALLNAMEGMDEASVPAQEQDCFLETIANTFGLTYARDVIEDCRNRLWFVYSMSAQYRDEDPSSSTSSSSTSSYSSPDSQHCVDCNNSKNTANTVVLKQQQQAADQLGAANNNNNTSGGLSSSPVSVVVSPIHQ